MAAASQPDGQPKFETIVDLGPLAGLVGSWAGDKGQLIMPVPSAGSHPDDVGKFTPIIKDYEETWTFTPLEEGVRNRGGAVDQFVGAIQYEQVVKSTGGDKKTLHVENGMLLYLGDTKPEQPPNADDSGIVTASPTIARSATVPHGNSCMLLGFSPNTSPGKPTFEEAAPAGLVPTNVGTAPLGYSDVYLSNSPLTVLTKALDGQSVTQTQTFVLDTANEGGISNTPFINTFAKAAGFKCFFWLETVESSDGASPPFQQLQYLQVVDIDFHKPFGSDAKGLIRWPHTLCNTLRLKE